MKLTGLFPLLAATLAFAACNRLAGADGMRLAGGWAPPGAACDSRGGVVYDKGGSWAGYDVEGRWTLNGDKLTTWVTERGGFDEPGHVVSGEKPRVSTVLSLSQTDLKLRQDDGSTLSLARCRP